MAELTPEWLAELRRIAEAATPGPWTSPWEQKDGLDPEEYAFYGASGDKIVGLLWYDGWHLECSEENARHIATFDPPTVLALLAEIERLRRVEEAARKLLDNRKDVGAGDDYVYLVPRNGDVDALEALLCGEGGGGE